MPLALYAQTQNRLADEKKDSIVPFKDRIAFRTNTIDWLLMLPNIAFEMDLSGSPYNRMALAVSAKGNWSTWHHTKPAWVYDWQNVRVELKKYGRTTNRFEREGLKRSFGDKLSDFFKMRVKNPNTWRAYYWGLYVDLGGYDFKFSEVGRYGKYVGAGITFGYGIPLYTYRSGAMDLELGASVGAVYTKFNEYSYNSEHDVFVDKPTVRKFLPYPVLSELRVALVYRFSSVRNKYKMIDYEKINRRAEEKMLREQAKKARKEAKLLEKSQQSGDEALKNEDTAVEQSNE